MSELLEVEMRCVGPDHFEGELGVGDKHERVVHLHFDGLDNGRVQLWQRHGFGKNPCGHGSLQRVGESWWGLIEDTVNQEAWTVNGEDFVDGTLLLVPAAASRRGKRGDQ
jgi:hypothetical protein